MRHQRWEPDDPERESDEPSSRGDPESGTVRRLRSGQDRRRSHAPPPTGLERRRGPGRRLSDFLKAAEEGQLTPEQFLFLMAIEAFKTANGKLYPTWTDVLEVVRLLGYRKTQPSQIRLRSAPDFTEPADAPAHVRRSGMPGRHADPGDDIPSREAA